MATIIDWNNYTSDGDPVKCSNRSSARLPAYLKKLNILVNKDEDIIHSFGKSGRPPHYSKERSIHYKHA